MPKPIYGINGSGMHTNISLYKNGKNIFYDESDKLGLSQEAYWFVGGLIAHAREIAALTNPIVNSYKRLIPGYEAPVYITWSAGNRSPLIRIPVVRGANTRVELRCPDPSCNPYLALAGILAAGLDGIENNINPSTPKNVNIFSMTNEQMQKEGIMTLPQSLKEAIDEMKNSSLVRKVLGNHIFEKYIEAKEEEWNDYCRQITPWELKHYLTKY
jgi:glutamine synthetase